MIDYKDVEPLLSGLWPSIMSMYGINVGDFKSLNTKNGPCPLCGGNDRAHWREQQGRIALFCRTCAADSMHSPENVIMDATGMSFYELVKNLADYVNHVPIEHIKKAKAQKMAQPTRNMPLSHKQDHELSARFLSGCEWCHSIEQLATGAPNPQKLPVKNNVDYWPMYNNDGVIVNLVKYVDSELQYIAGGMSWGASYKIQGSNQRIIVIDPLDGILCWYKTQATIIVAFTLDNLRYILSQNLCGDGGNPVVCVRDMVDADEFSWDNENSVRLLTGDAYGKKENGFLINKMVNNFAI